jgi:glycosyltransferase involved in cell wall biosynthesis
MEHNLRVLFSCTGVGIFNRGIESFFRDSFDGLKNAMPGIEVRLLKGAGEADAREKRVWCLQRTSAPARLLGCLIRRNAYVAEQLSSFPFVAREIHRWKPDVVFYSDSNLGFQLYRWRRQIGVPFKLLFSNGGPCHPPFVRTDFVHQVAPFYLDEALRAGEPPEKHFFVPYGINVPGAPVSDPAGKRGIRKKLGLPLDRPIVLSVGWISREHKRMDYVIEEMARLPEPRPFLQLLGAMDERSQEIVGLGNRLLGMNNFAVASVSYEQVAEYYQAADCFVLASLKEGFGRVYLEAMMHGLAVIAHRHPVIEYVVGREGTLANLDQPGELAALLPGALQSSGDAVAAQRRWQSVRDRFHWPVLAPAYQAMFEAVAKRSLPVKAN